MAMKGIILAGGSGTRLYPVTLGVSKHILPVYNKPLIFYPISTLMLAGIREILIISTPHHINSYRSLFGDGSSLGVNFQYAIQPSPGGLAEAFIVGEDFIGKDNIALILGDNIFFGNGLSDLLARAVHRKNGATIFAHQVKDPSRFGVLEFSKDMHVLSIEEKPKFPKSDYAVTGLYFYDNNVIKYAKTILPSKRGELEITDINNIYLSNKELNVEFLGRGFAWFDTGTFDSLLDAACFIRAVESNQNVKIADLEEIARTKGFIKSTKTNKCDATI